MTYVIGGKVVCGNVWLQVLPLSLSHFYRLRQECVKYKSESRAKILVLKNNRFFRMDGRILGMCREHKDGIYRPMCLTENDLIVVEQLGMERCVSPSQFNKNGNCKMNCVHEIKVMHHHINLHTGM